LLGGGGGVKGGQGLGLKILPQSFDECLEIWETQIAGKLTLSRPVIG